MSGSHTYDHTRSNGHSIVNGEEEGDDDEDDEDEVMGREADGEDIGHHTAASLQYWTAPRHGKGKGKSRVDEEYCEFHFHFGDISGMRVGADGTV